MAKKRQAKKTKRKRTAKRRKRSTRILGVPIPPLVRAELLSYGPGALLVQSIIANVVRKSCSTDFALCLAL